MVKENYINSSQDVPWCLSRIAEYLSNINLETSKSKDGRVGSIEDEKTCIELLRKSEEFDVFEYGDNVINPDKITCIIPNIREWFDLEVLYKNKHYYVNIKSSTLTSTDNVGSISSLLFGMFGKKMIIKNNKSEQYSKLFYEYNKHKENDFECIKDYDYYYLVINKNRTDNVFITSLNHINSSAIVSNGSNLPFQCKWSKFSLNIEMSKSKICDLIMNTVFDSLVKSLDLFEQEPIKIYMDRNKKKVDLPVLW